MKHEVPGNSYTSVLNNEWKARVSAVPTPGVSSVLASVSVYKEDVYVGIFKHVLK